MFAVGSYEVSQVLGGLADAGEGEGALCGSKSPQSSQVIGVVSRFSPDSLESGHSRSEPKNFSGEVVNASKSDAC